MTDRIVCDVSAWDAPAPAIEIHRLAERRQTGERTLPDGSHTGGLGVTLCGLEQATRGHGWFVITDPNEYQAVRIGTEWPICAKCFPTPRLG